MPRHVTMASLCGFCPGRHSIFQMAFILLALSLVALLLTRGFWDWFVSSTVNMCLTMAFQDTGVSGSLSSNGTGNDKMTKVLNLFNATSIDDVPTACLFPRINIYEPSVMRIAGIGKKTIRCDEAYVEELTYVTEDNKLMVDQSKVRESVKNTTFRFCRYRNISRVDEDDKNFKYSEWSEPFTDFLELSQNTEFLKVECMGDNALIISKSFYYFIPKKEEFDEIYSMNVKKRQALYAPKETLNVIMIGMDTLMRNQFIRGCKKTYSYLMKKLKSIDLTMHSQVGINTFPNMVPLYTGLSVEEIKSWWDNTYHIDTYDMLTDHFEAAGYRTLFTEDDTLSGVFHYLTKGFKKHFTRYNSRPLILAMDNDTNIIRNKHICLGNQVQMNYHLDYISRFLDLFPDKPVFAAAFFTWPTHDDTANASMFDKHLLDFYKSLEEKGHLTRSLLLSFSDHGVKFGPMRETVNGHVEGKTPYAIFTFPDWFVEKYPEVIANFKANTKRLTSHYDTRVTLLDLLYFKSSMPPPLAPSRHGISLFEKIPWDRTCADAHIPPDYCLCGYTGLEEIKLTSKLAIILSVLVIRALNTKADKRICAMYTLSEIKNILKFSINDGSTKGGSSSVVYRVKLVVQPGEALFEANVYTKPNSTEMTVGSDISRLNLFKKTADCVLEASSKPYCYCKNLLPS